MSKALAKPNPTMSYIVSPVVTFDKSHFIRRSAKYCILQKLKKFRKFLSK